MNIAFYPFWGAKTLHSLVQVISGTTMTCLVYKQTEMIRYTLLFLCVYVMAYLVASVMFQPLIKRCTLSRLMITVPMNGTLLLIGMAFILHHLVLPTILLFTAGLILSVMIRWESLLLEAIQPLVLEGEDLSKANKLLSFSTYTITGAGLAMAAITIVYLGITQALWAASCLSFVALVLIMNVNHLINSLQSPSNKRYVRPRVHK
ncbi:hypothetical protein PAECIP112173_02098 [Paenibacillus sp. JJ-100]|uniref:hypothetical protein n=1 Tax=Paenibacillus sp. JJ-100 TaxID=2974896 RepID=UPI0022FF69EE|nr:hypothetical protein [Paenibacillus sp. JJ-100]CAI6068892.1 hypothetical protein PAECIP112173_02098 [Paenibacillus sp. JJ-100]